MNAYAMTNEQITAYGANLRMEERSELWSHGTESGGVHGLATNA